jgi:hypothetical protein
MTEEEARARYIEALEQYQNAGREMKSLENLRQVFIFLLRLTVGSLELFRPSSRSLLPLPDGNLKQGTKIIRLFAISKRLQRQIDF